MPGLKTRNLRQMCYRNMVAGSVVQLLPTTVQISALFLHLLLQRPLAKGSSPSLGLQQNKQKLFDPIPDGDLQHQNNEPEPRHPHRG